MKSISSSGLCPKCCNNKSCLMAFPLWVSPDALCLKRILSIMKGSIEDPSEPMYFVLSSCFVLCSFVVDLGLVQSSRLKAWRLKSSLSTEHIWHRQWPCSSPPAQQCASLLAEGARVEEGRSVSIPFTLGLLGLPRRVST